ncbi:Uncharacterised protein [Legionella sainthelensi]|uniref:hypothetical protein n=1 Tax=Legionella sainthelensi TaxID=28087 RepID=UPI000E1FF97B|nr:hypothetical protein [Legionella sainthelensi]VEB32372.1 Uncharacterised protein [Legionella sainthelensi]
MFKPSIVGVREQLNIAKLKKFNNEKLQKLFQKFYWECAFFFEEFDKISIFECNRVFFFLKEMNVLATQLNNSVALTPYEFYQYQQKIYGLMPGMPERICNYGLRFAMVAFYTISFSTCLGLLFGSISMSLPLLITGLIIGACMGAAIGVAEGNAKVDGWCYRFFRSKDPDPIKAGDAFIQELDNLLNPNEKMQVIHNPNGTDIGNNYFANCLPF